MSEKQRGTERRDWRVAHDGRSLAVVEVTASHVAPTAPVALIAHGAGSSATFVEAAFAGPLADAGLRLATYDLRGHGGSQVARSAEHHHLDVHADDLAAVAASLDGEVAVIGGVSLGAHAAVRATSREVVSARSVLACLPAWTGKAIPGQGPHAATAVELHRLGVAGVVERLRTEPGLPRWLRETLMADYHRHDPASLIAALTSLDGGEAPSRTELSALSVPLAVVGWADDPGHPLEVARTWAEAAAEGQLVVMELAAMDRGVASLGEAAVAALVATGIVSLE